MSIRELRAKACLSNWFPMIAAARLPVPKTRIIRTDCRLDEFLDGEEPKGIFDFILTLREAVGEIGLPAFLRTGQTSGKHEWKDTCLLTGNTTTMLYEHVANIVEYSALAERREVRITNTDDYMVYWVKEGRVVWDGNGTPPAPEETITIEQCTCDDVPAFLK